jgi:nucleotide-binding universal stress UspA family protein
MNLGRGTPGARGEGMSTHEAILVPIDFSDASHAALAKARTLAARLDMEIVLLHVYTIPLVSYPGTEPLLFPGLTGDIVAAAKRALDDLARASNVERTLMREGDPAAEILRAIEELKPGMVVMGTQGRHGFAHLLLGSVAEKVVRMSQAPVLTLHALKKDNPKA